MSEISDIIKDRPKPRHYKVSGTLWMKVPRKSGRRILSRKEILELTFGKRNVTQEPGRLISFLLLP